MTFLEICQRVHDIVGYQGQFTSVQATGYQAVLTTAVKETYEDVQRYRAEWDWLRNMQQVNVDSSKSYYTLADLWTPGASDLAEYLYLNWQSPTRTRRLQEVHYDSYQLLVSTDGHKPLYWASEPQTKALLISPVDDLYTLDLYYMRTLDILSGNTDEPLIPQRHQQIIIYGACMKLSTFVGNPTLYDTYSVKYAEELGQLMREENPAKVVTKRPIA